MASRKVEVNGQSCIGAEPFKGSELACKAVDAVSDILDGNTWGVVMSVLAELSMWAAGQLLAGVDAVSPFVDSAHEALGVVPVQPDPQEEAIVPDARVSQEWTPYGRTPNDPRRPGG